MKLHLFQQLLDLNQAFEQVLRGLERMEKLPFFHAEELRYARAEVREAGGTEKLLQRPVPVPRNPDGNYARSMRQKP